MTGTMTRSDSLKVTENDDGSFDVSWDTDDPTWSFLNDMTKEQINEWFNNAVKEGLKRYENMYTIPVEEDAITGEQFITFPQDCIQQLGWKEGDVLLWIDNKDGTFTIQKRGDKTSQMS